MTLNTERCKVVIDPMSKQKWHVEGNSDEIAALAEVVLDELDRALENHGGFCSAHEGYAVMLEELDELWEEIKKKNQSRLRMMEESTQVAAMSIKFMLFLRNGGGE